MTKWKPFEEIPKDGTPVLVQLEEEITGSIMQVARFNGDMGIIGSYFHFDCPKIVCWTDLPEPKAI